MSEKNDNLLRFKPIERFRRLLKVDQKDITQVYAYALFNGLVNLTLPLGIQAIINLIQGGEMNTAWMILVAFVIGGVAMTGVFQLLQLRIVENLAQKIFSRASFEFAYRMPKIKHGALYNYYAPELANRFFDTMTIQKGLPKILIDFSLALFQIIIGLIVLSFYHPFFILFSIILIALIYLILSLTGAVGLKTSIKESTLKYKIAFWLEEIARTKIAFKLVGDSDLNLSKTDYHVSKYLTARESHFTVLVRQFMYLIGFKVLIAAGLLITGSILVFNQEMNIGQFVAAEIIIILIIASVEKLIQSLDAVYDVLTALEKIGYVSDLPLDSDSGLELDTTEEGLSVTLNQVSFSYPDAPYPTLKDVNFEVPAGESVLIYGPANSGKSTLLQLVAGILEPDAGLVKFRGFPLKSIQREELRKQIGFSIGNDGIFQGTILENITMNRPEASAENIGKALKITGLNKYIASIPYGLNTVLDPEGKKIPRNIQNRINLARAIATMPQLLVLEDPLDHVNQSEKRDIIEALIDHQNPWAIIVTSVDNIWQEYIHHKIEIENGQIINSTLNPVIHAEYKPYQN